MVYLGFVISVEGLKMDPKKVRVIIEWPTLESIAKLDDLYTTQIP